MHSQTDVRCKGLISLNLVCHQKTILTEKITELKTLKKIPQMQRKKNLLEKIKENRKNKKRLEEKSLKKKANQLKKKKKM